MWGAEIPFDLCPFSPAAWLLLASVSSVRRTGLGPLMFANLTHRNCQHAPWFADARPGWLPLVATRTTIIEVDVEVVRLATALTVQRSHEKSSDLMNELGARMMMPSESSLLPFAAVLA